MFDDTYICKTCGKPFAARRRALYCSVACKSKARYYSQAGKAARFARGSYKWLTRPKTYAEIKADNRGNPAKAGWRGRPVAGGGPNLDGLY